MARAAERGKGGSIVNIVLYSIVPVAASIAAVTIAVSSNREIELAA
jgi:hypothetical protein